MSFADYDLRAQLADEHERRLMEQEQHRNEITALRAQLAKEREETTLKKFAQQVFDELGGGNTDQESMRAIDRLCRSVLFPDTAAPPASAAGKGRCEVKACPKCNGAPEAPEVEGCHGCFECDFSGTLAGYRKMQRMLREAWEECDKMEAEHAEYVKRGVCSKCGATSARDAETKCRPSCPDDSGEYTCPGADLWHEEETAQPPAQQGKDGAK